MSLVDRAVTGKVGALAGLRVLDLACDVAGAFCARVLAGLGADVVKIEPPEGDPVRYVGVDGADRLDQDRSPLFLYLNQGKKSAVLDLGISADRTCFELLVARADVLVDSGPYTEGRNLDLSYTALTTVNPSLIVANLSDFGSDGPYRDYRSAQIVNAALGGLLYLTGEPDREPLMPFGWQPAYLTGTSAAIGILLALNARRRWGTGQQVEVAAMEVVASCLEGALASASAGNVRRRRGNRVRFDNPLLLLPCRDGHVVVTIASKGDWEAFCRFVGDERLQDSRLATADGREAHAAELEVILRQWLAGVTRAEFFRSAQEWRFPCCSVLAPDELAEDSQHQAREFFVAIDHPLAGTLKYPGAPFRMPNSPWRFGRAPLVGEQNHELDRLWDGGPDGEWAGSNLPGEDGKRDAASLSEGALAGLRVLDLTSMWAGPFCTRLLADAGAEVIKVELASRSDGTRESVVGPLGLLARGGLSPFFQELNRNKLGITLDLRQAIDRRRFLDLVARTDVLVENFSPRVMPNLGLDYEVLRQQRPDLIMLSMPAFGSTGPMANAVAFGSGLEAMSGLSWLTGYPDGGPELLGVAYGDPVAGLFGSAAILAALVHRNRSGEGQHVELAQREALTQFIGEKIVGVAMGRPVPRLGNGHSDMVPHGCYPCAGDDQWLAIAVENDAQWRRLCEVIGDPELASDPRFSGIAGRKDNREAIDRILSAWTQLYAPREAMRRLQAAGVSAGAVLDPAGLLADPHFRERGFIARIDLGPEHPPLLCPGPLVRLSASPLSIARPAPLLGEHNRLTLLL